MKSIQDYIKEGLLSKKNISGIHTPNGAGMPIERFRNGSVKFDWPNDEKCERWKTIKLEKPDKFTIFYDSYHRAKHIASFGGMLESFIYNSTYEDFTPESLIKGFKTLKDAVEYAVNDGIDDYYDSQKFIDGVINGNIKEKDYNDTSYYLDMFKIPDHKSVESLMNSIY